MSEGPPTQGNFCHVYITISGRCPEYVSEPHSLAMSMSHTLCSYITVANTNLYRNVNTKDSHGQNVLTYSLDRLESLCIDVCLHIHLTHAVL